MNHLYLFRVLPKNHIYAIYIKGHGTEKNVVSEVLFKGVNLIYRINTGKSQQRPLCFT